MPESFNPRVAVTRSQLIALLEKTATFLSTKGGLFEVGPEVWNLRAAAQVLRRRAELPDPPAGVPLEKWVTAADERERKRLIQQARNG